VTNIASIKDFSIAIIDDHECILHGAASFLRTAFPHTGISIFSEEQSFLKHIQNRTYDIYIVDLELKEMQGVELITEIRKMQPGSRIIVYTMHEELWIIKQLIQFKVNGIVLKNSSLDLLQKAVEEVAEGRTYFCQRFRYITQEFNNSNPDSYLLTEDFNDTYLEIIRLIAKGKDSPEIAQITGKTLHTIMSYRKDIFRKFGVNSAPELTAKAFANGFITKRDIKNTEK